MNDPGRVHMLTVLAVMLMLPIGWAFVAFAVNCIGWPA